MTNPTTYYGAIVLGVIAVIAGVMMLNNIVLGYHGKLGLGALVVASPPVVGSAVLDEGGLAVAGVCRTYGKVVRIRSGAWSYKTPAVPFLAVLPVF